MSVLIVGAGPAGLACALALRCRGAGDDVEVVDPLGRWLAAWDRRFRAQDIPHLRSPSVHHPHPDPFALLAHVDRDELVSSGGTQLPTSAAFAAFCRDTIRAAGLQDRVLPARVEALELTAGGRAVAALSDGTVRRPDHIVLATNARRPALPPPLAAACTPTGPVRHAEEVDLDRDTPPGAHVVVVGGGLSAAHLALGTVRRGARVTLLTRRRLQVRRFDVDPTWLGPKRRRPFETDPDPVRRRRAINHARGGGTIPHRYRRALADGEQAGLVAICERVEITGAAVTGHRVAIEVAGPPSGTPGSRRGTLEADRVWLATGGTVDVTADELCRELRTRFATPVVDGLPELTDDLCWPGTRVHLAGFAAALKLGPTAGNLVGHRRAGLRIAAAVCGEDPVRADRLVTGAAACPHG